MTVPVKNLNENRSIGLSMRMLISLESGSTLPSRPEITLNSRAGCPDTGTAHPKGLTGTLNKGNVLENVFHLGNVG